MRINRFCPLLIGLTALTGLVDSPCGRTAPLQQSDKAMQTDLYGDPLPPGVVSRFGTVSFASQQMAVRWSSRSTASESFPNATLGKSSFGTWRPLNCSTNCQVAIILGASVLPFPKTADFWRHPVGTP